MSRIDYSLTNNDNLKQFPMLTLWMLYLMSRDVPSYRAQSMSSWLLVLRVHYTHPVRGRCQFILADRMWYLKFWLTGNKCNYTNEFPFSHSPTRICISKHQWIIIEIMTNNLFKLVNKMDCTLHRCRTVSLPCAITDNTLHSHQL